jgi:hypothetical protein
MDDAFGEKEVRFGDIIADPQAQTFLCQPG